jgi:hypothetical protein
MSIHPEDMRPGLYVAIRFARQHPQDEDWAHIAVPAVYRILSVAVPYVALECLNTGRKIAADLAVYEFEQLRPEFVAALFPGAIAAPAPAPKAARPADDRDEQGYPKPVRLATIKSPGGRR